MPSQVHRVDTRKKEPKPMLTKAEALAGESDIISDALKLDELNVIPGLRREMIAGVEIHGQWGAKVSCADHVIFGFR